MLLKIENNCTEVVLLKFCTCPLGTLERRKKYNSHTWYSQPVDYTFLEMCPLPLIKKKAERVGGKKMFSTSMTLLENYYFKTAYLLKSWQATSILIAVSNFITALHR